MKPVLFLCTILLLCIPTAHSQKTPADFGAMGFWCFQHNRLDSLFKWIPTVQDLSGFAKELGIKEGTEAYSSFLKRYPLVIQNFKDRCYQIQRDSLEYKFSWVKARIEKLDPQEKSFAAENTPNKNPVSMTVLNIYFISAGQSFLLKFGDLHQYTGIWKPGNKLSLAIQYK